MGLPGLAAPNLPQHATQGNVLLGDVGAVLRLEVLDDVLLVRAIKGDFLVPFGNYAAVARKPIRLGPGVEDATGQTGTVLRRWQPVVRTADCFAFASGRTIHVVERKALARLVPDIGSRAVPTRALSAPGEVLALTPRDRPGATDVEFVALVNSSTGLALAEYCRGSWTTRTAPHQTSPSLDWTAFCWPLNGGFRGVLLGLRFSDPLRSDGVLSSAEAFDISGATSTISSVRLGEEALNAHILTGRAAYARRSQVVLSAQPADSNRPVAVLLTLGAQVLNCQPLRDKGGHTISFGADIGFVEMGVYTAFGLGTKDGLAWAGDMGRPGAVWRPPADWDPQSAGYAFDGALAAGVVGTRFGTYLLVADLQEGRLQCRPRFARISDIEMSVLAVALQNDVLWLVSREHGEQRVRWYHLPSFGEFHE